MHFLFTIPDCFVVNVLCLLFFFLFYLLHLNFVINLFTNVSHYVAKQVKEDELKVD